MMIESATGRAKKILVVDDNPASRELVREILTAPTRDVLEARHGQEALEMIPVVKPDLVLLDIHMPVLDGFSVLRKIRENPRWAQLRVVAVTAFAMDGDRERALAAGFTDYITKPARPAELRSTVGRFLDQ